jgi:HPt (histidine-containing phosphotransfer) domain-containing protein
MSDPKGLELLHSLQAEHPDLMTDLIRLFVADVPEQMRRIVAGYGECDVELLRQSAHFLRSGAMALGLLRLAEHSLAVERLDPAQYGLADADRKVDELRVELGKALLAMLKDTKAKDG